MQVLVLTRSHPAQAALPADGLRPHRGNLKFLKKAPNPQGPLTVGPEARGCMSLSVGEIAPGLTDLYWFRVFPLGIHP